MVEQPIYATERGRIRCITQFEVKTWCSYDTFLSFGNVIDRAACFTEFKERSSRRKKGDRDGNHIRSTVEK